MEHVKEYYAFISYKREDEGWAKWLQHKLEHYKLPSNLNGRTDLPKEIRPVFRDKSDLTGGVLAEEINSALENSQYLIVICSPRAAQSEWVSKEVQSFIAMGRVDRIIPFIVGGEAHAKRPEDECFPVALKDLPDEQELIGANINDMGRDAAAVKVVAQMFGLQFDELWNRHEREQKRKRNWIIAASVAAFIIVLGVAGWIWHQNVELKQQRWQMLESQSKLVSEMIKLNVQDDSYLARMAALEVLPKDLKNQDRPYTSEAEKALRTANLTNSAVLKGHSNSINIATFSEDGNRIISCSLNDTNSLIKIWDAVSGCELKSLHISMQSVFGLNMNDNGQFLALSRYTDSILSIYDVNTGDEISSMTNSCAYIDLLAISNDGKMIVTLAYDSTLIIRNTFTGAELMRTKEPMSLICFASFSSNGRFLALALSDNLDSGTFISSGNKEVYSDNNIKIIDIELGKVINKWKGHNNLISSLAFSPDDTQLVTASYDGTIKTWDVYTGEELATSSKVCASLTHVCFSPDGKQIATAAYDGTISTWEASSCKEILTLSGHSSKVNHVKFSRDGKRIVSASDDNTIRIWDVGYVNEDGVILKTDDYFSSFALSPNYQSFAIIVNTILTVKNIKTGNTILSVDMIPNGRPWTLAFSQDGEKIILGYDADTLKVLDINTGEVLYNLMQDGFFKTLNSVSFSSDGKKMVSNLINARVGIWDVENDAKPTMIQRSISVYTTVFSPDDKYILLGGGDKVIVFLDAETLEEEKVFVGHTNGINSISFSPDGKKIVSGSADKTAIIWDYATGEVIMSLVGHTSGLSCVSFSPDGRYVVTASYDNTIRVWDAKTGQCVHIIDGHKDAVTFASFTSDEKHIISASQDNTIRLWDFPPLQDLIDQTRERFKDRPLTPEERRMYYLE